MGVAYRPKALLQFSRIEQSLYDEEVVISLHPFPRRGQEGGVKAAGVILSQKEVLEGRHELPSLTRSRTNLRLQLPLLLASLGNMVLYL